MYNYKSNLETRYEEGKAEGFSQLSKLIELLSDEERYADIKKIAKDAAYRDMLMKEYNLI